MAHLWARWLHHPCRLGDPLRFRAGGTIRSGPLVGKVATSPLPPPGSPPPQSGGQNQKWHTCGQGGYVTRVASGIPGASERGQNQKWPTCGQGGYVTAAASGIPSASWRGAKSEVAYLWARWLRSNECWRSVEPRDHQCLVAVWKPGSGIAVHNVKFRVLHLFVCLFHNPLPTSGPLLILPPALKRRGSSRWQG